VIYLIKNHYKLVYVQTKLKNVCFAFYTAGFDDKYVITTLSNQRIEDGRAGDNAAGHLSNIIMRILCSKINLVDFICHAARVKTKE